MRITVELLSPVSRLLTIVAVICGGATFISLSAAQFIHDQRDAVALVASQDGRFTVFGWSASRQTVVAHRLEALLL